MKFGYIDAHADTITRAKESSASLFKNKLHIDFLRLAEFDAPVVQVFAIYTADKYLKNAFEYTNSAIDFFESELEKHSGIKLACSLEDIEKNARNNISSALLSLEGGEALEGSLEKLEHFYKRGVRIITLTWNRENELGYGTGTDSQDGLKPFGIKAVKKMNELGMIIDVSHINEKGFWDVHKYSAMPFMASHSNARAVANHKRNLNDDQIKAIVEKDGIIGINFFPDFLETNGNANINSIKKHINHFIKLGAAKNIGLGSDFDGVSRLPDGITDVTSLKNLSENIPPAIMSENFREFFKRCM
jgi:membrane dipeptidase